MHISFFFFVECSRLGFDLFIAAALMLATGLASTPSAVMQSFMRTTLVSSRAPCNGRRASGDVWRLSLVKGRSLKNIECLLGFKLEQTCTYRKACSWSGTKRRMDKFELSSFSLQSCSTLLRGDKTLCPLPSEGAPFGAHQENRGIAKARAAKGGGPVGLPMCDAQLLCYPRWETHPEVILGMLPNVLDISCTTFEALKSPGAFAILRSCFPPFQL